MTSETRAAPGWTEVGLAAVLAAVSGAVDVLAFTQLGHAFASVITGNLVVVGTSVGVSDPILFSRAVIAVLAFAVGVAAGSIGVRVAGESTARWPVQTTAVCTAELAVLLVLAGVWFVTGGMPAGTAQVVALVAAALAMGLQTAAFRLVRVPGVTTTYFTGTLTGLLSGLVVTRRVNVAAVVALVALLTGAGAAGLLVARALAAAVLLPLALLATVVVVSFVLRERLWSPR